MSACFMVKKRKPRIDLVYIHVIHDVLHLELAKRFSASLKACPAGVDHGVLVVCNGGSPPDQSKHLFDGLPNVRFFVHDDSGWDIGGYIAAARESIKECDVMVPLSGHAYFKREGWLARFMEVWDDLGPGMYGSLATYEVSPHLNTTGFICEPSLLSAYPVRVNTKAQRYDFEHGPNALWKMCIKEKVPVRLVTWDGEYEWWDWRNPDNIYRRGDQSNCLTFFNHTMNFENANEETRALWAGHADMLTDPMYRTQVKATYYPIVQGREFRPPGKWSANYEANVSLGPHRRP